MAVPFPEELTLIQRVALQLMNTPTSRDTLITVLGLQAASDVANLDTKLDWLEQRGLITAASMDADLRHHLTPLGRQRAHLSQTLGLRTLTGLEPNQLTVLRILISAPNKPVNLRAMFGNFTGGIARDMEAVAQGLAREGFVGDSVQRFAPGSKQAPQWFVTDDGLALMECLGLLPDPAGS